VISSNMPGVTANATYSKELKIVEASNKLTQLGGAAGAIAALMLLAALYAARHECLRHLAIQIGSRRCWAAATVSCAASAPPTVVRCRYLFARHGAKAKAVLLSIVQREVKMVWSMLGEGFDMAGDTAVFIAIKDDAQNPVLRATVSAIVIPVWISFCLSVVVSIISLLVRGSIAVVQCRRRRGDVAQIGGRVPYLQRLEAKIEDGEREIKMVARPHRAPAHLAHPPPHHCAHAPPSQLRTRTRTRSLLLSTRLVAAKRA
jgi:hypothetical protein